MPGRDGERAQRRGVRCVRRLDHPRRLRSAAARRQLRLQPRRSCRGGLGHLRHFRARDTAPPVIAIAEEGNELTAVRAIQLGALDYLPKRLLTPERLSTSVKLAMRRVERRIARRMAKLAQSSGTSDQSAHDEEEREEPATQFATDLIPGYTLGVTLGESEKAVVHRAISHALNRDVALKISKSERSEGQLLAREYAAVSNLRHGAIVQIHDYGTHAGREYLAMELFAPRRSQSAAAAGRDRAGGFALCRAHRERVAGGAWRRAAAPGPEAPNVMLREDDERGAHRFRPGEESRRRTAEARAPVSCAARPTT